MHYALIAAVSDVNIIRSWNQITHIVLLISQLPDIVQKCVCTLDGPMDPTFQIASLWQEILSKNHSGAFFEPPCRLSSLDYPSLNEINHE